MLNFLLSPFATWDCYYLESNLSLVLLRKVVPIKKEFDYICFLYWADIVKKCQKLGFREKDMSRGGGWGGGGL